MFCVYGVTIQGARKKADKKLSDSLRHRKPQPTPEEYERELLELTEQYWKKMKPERISGEFSSPDFCGSYIASAKKTVRCRNLETRIRIPKTDKKGGLVINKKSGKPTLTWEIYDSTKDYRAVIRKMEELTAKAA